MSNYWLYSIYNITISKIEDLNSIFAKILQNGYCAIDTETDSLNIESANLVGISLCFNESFAYYIPINHKDLFNYNLLDNQIEEKKVCVRVVSTFFQKWFSALERRHLED